MKLPYLEHNTVKVGLVHPHLKNKSKQNYHVIHATEQDLLNTQLSLLAYFELSIQTPPQIGLVVKTQDFWILVGYKSTH